MIRYLPSDWLKATLLGRLQTADGPTPILIKGGQVFDMSVVAPTVAASYSLD
jgi:fumarylacetoacetate (FAA) hydrolase family protein